MPTSSSATPPTESTPQPSYAAQADPSANRRPSGHESEPPPARDASPPFERPHLLSAAGRKLGLVERTILRIVRASFKPGFFQTLLPWFQRTIGQAWIYHATARLCHVRGLERVPTLQREREDEQSVLVVANHRSFFDLYVITARLVRGGLRKRIVFPVRSDFFYDSWLGLIVNFWMSFLSMYPPLFRDKKKASLNLLALDELAWLLERGGVFAGLHPEGTRKRDDDPYTFLPARPGVGRVIYRARTTVVPVFINGLGNNLLHQVWSNFTGKGQPVLVVYGEPINFDDLLSQPASSQLYRQIAERCMQAVGKAGEEERLLRAQLTQGNR